MSGLAVSLTTDGRVSYPLAFRPTIHKKKAEIFQKNETFSTNGKIHDYPPTYTQKQPSIVSGLLRLKKTLHPDLIRIL